jgi:uncharacterized protein YcnI
MRRPLIPAIAVLGLLAAAPVALGHVEVLPTTGVVEQAQEFVIRVPTERPLPTTGLQVTFPPQVTVYAFGAPPAGWRMTPIQRNGRYVGVRYTGGSIPVGQFRDFPLLGTPTVKGVALWKSLQTYADGKVKPWIAAPQAPGAASPESGPTDPGPAPAVTIAAAGASATAPGPASTRGSSGVHSGAAIWLGVIAIGLAALACVAVGFLWSSRPMALPDDDDSDHS